MTVRMDPYEKHFGLVKPLIDFSMKIQAYGLERRW